MTDDPLRPESQQADGPADSQPSSTSEPRWWQRVVPVTALALGLAAAVAFLPGMDDEVELSTQRSAEPFVELFMITRPVSFCAKGRPKVRFRLQSHLTEVEELTYVVATDPKGRGKVHRKVGRVSLAPGDAQSRQLRIAAPVGGDYTVTVRLRGRPEMLRVHCAGGRS